VQCREQYRFNTTLSVLEACRPHESGLQSSVSAAPIPLERPSDQDGFLHSATAMKSPLVMYAFMRSACQRISMFTFTQYELRTRHELADSL